MEMNHDQQDTHKHGHDEDVHVHFKKEDIQSHESEIQVVLKEDGVKEVHLGFLQFHHVYEVTFPLTHSLGKEVTFEPRENSLVKVKSMEQIDNGHQMIVEFNAHRDKVIEEKVTFAKCCH